MDARIGLIAVSDPARQDPAQWQMPGMRATRSGGYNFTGLSADEVEWIGPNCCYVSEPGFVSGVWRIAAFQLGATLGLLDSAVSRLRALGRLEAEPQLIRLTPLVIRAIAGEALVLRAAVFAEGSAIHAAPEHGVALSAAARLLTEEIAQRSIPAVEQSVGLAHFGQDSETGRIAADLAVYLRQAARDALVRRVGTHAFLGDDPVWGMLS